MEIRLIQHLPLCVYSKIEQIWNNWSLIVMEIDGEKKYKCGNNNDICGISYI